MLLKQLLQYHRLKKLLLAAHHLLGAGHLLLGRFVERFPIEHPYQTGLGHPDRVVVLLVGCGGVGSFAAQVLAQVAGWASAAGLDLRLYFIDPGLVEAENLVRDNFCRAELAQPRAHSLAWRYAAAYELGIQGVMSRFRRNMLALYRPSHSSRTATIIVNTVASARVRRDVAEAILSWSEGRLGPRSPDDQLWWLDAAPRSGSEGFLTIGNSFDKAPTLSSDGRRRSLPFPHLQEPDLLQAEIRPMPSSDAGSGLSREIAVWIGIYLDRLLRDRLDIRATRIHLRTGTVHSTPISAGSLPVRAWPGKPAPAVGFEPIRFDHRPCPACGHPLVRSQSYYQGVLFGRLACSRCAYQEEVCPECWAGRTDDGELAQDGQQVPAFFCTECAWTAAVDDSPAPVQSRPVGPLPPEA